jgi:hypothetical protein
MHKMMQYLTNSNAQEDANIHNTWPRTMLKMIHYVANPNAQEDANIHRYNDDATERKKCVAI